MSIFMYNDARIKIMYQHLMGKKNKTRIEEAVFRYMKYDDRVIEIMKRSDIVDPTSDAYLKEKYIYRRMESMLIPEPIRLLIKTSNGNITTLYKIASEGTEEDMQRVLAQCAPEIKKLSLNQQNRILKYFENYHNLSNDYKKVSEDIHEVYEGKYDHDLLTTLNNIKDDRILRSWAFKTVNRMFRIDILLGEIPPEIDITECAIYIEKVIKIEIIEPISKLDNILYLYKFEPNSNSQGYNFAVVEDDSIEWISFDNCFRTKYEAECWAMQHYHLKELGRIKELLKSYKDVKVCDLNRFMTKSIKAIDDAIYHLEHFH